MVLHTTLARRQRDRPQADLPSRFRAQVLAAFDQVERIVLFGSRVRGDVHDDSDWDFAVYLDHGPDQDEKKRLGEIGRVLSAETDQEVQGFLLAPERWRATDELACNIRDEGVIIHGEDDKPMIERPVLQHARDALDKAGRFAPQAEAAMPEAYETVVHNSYYAMLHAARAALLAVQGTASTNHGRVVVSFARMVEREELGAQANDLARIFTEAHTLRADADYGNKDLTEQGQALRAQMRPFMALCVRLVDERVGS